MSNKDAVTQIVAGLKAEQTKLANDVLAREQAKSDRAEFLRDCKKWFLEIADGAGASRAGKFVIKYFYPKTLCAMVVLGITPKKSGHELHEKYLVSRQSIFNEPVAFTIARKIQGRKSFELKVPKSLVKV